jgi:hypothetical protein
MSRRERGMTLVIALVMLIVLTLLVVSAIRFSNINLRISGNVQAETEAVSAAQLAVEQTVKTIITSPNISTIPNQVDLPVSTGGQTYKVTVTKPSCIFNKPVNSTDLDPAQAADRVCFESGDAEKLVTASGALTTVPTACKEQQWDVGATVNGDSAASGAAVSVLQGVAVRVGAEVVCP